MDCKTRENGLDQQPIRSAQCGSTGDRKCPQRWLILCFYCGEWRGRAILVILDYSQYYIWACAEGPDACEGRQISWDDHIYQRILSEVGEEIVGALAEVYECAPGSLLLEAIKSCASIQERLQRKTWRLQPVGRKSVVGNSLENILWENIYMHCDVQRHIMDSHPGFFSGSSCITHLIECSEDIDEGRAADIVLQQGIG